MKLSHCLLSLGISGLVVGSLACTITTTNAGADAGTLPGTDSGGTTIDTDGGTTTGTDGGTTTDGGASSETGTTTGDSGGGVVDTGPPSMLNEVEPNNDFATAQVVPINGTVNANWTASDDDFYSVTIPAGNLDGYLTMTINESTTVSPRVELFNQAQTALKTFDAKDGTTNPSVFKWAATAGKTYLLKATDYYNKPAPYTLAVTFTPVNDPNERNDDFSTAKPATLGTAFDVIFFAGEQTNNGDDTDFFTLAVPATGVGKLRFELTNNSTAEEPQSPRIVVYGANKASLDTLDVPSARANLDETWDVPAGTAGTTLYLSIKDYYDRNSAVASRVTVTGLP